MLTVYNDYLVSTLAQEHPVPTKNTMGYIKHSQACSIYHILCCLQYNEDTKASASEDNVSGSGESSGENDDADKSGESTGETDDGHSHLPPRSLPPKKTISTLQTNLSVGVKLDIPTMRLLQSLVRRLLQDESQMVREASCLAVGAILGASPEPQECLRDLKGCILKCMRCVETSAVHQCVARGLCIAIRMNSNVFSMCWGVEGGNGSGSTAGSEGLHKSGVAILDTSLVFAMSGTSDVKRLFHDFLWLALRVGEGEEGLHEYMALSQGENGKIMMTLVTKVLGRMSGISEEEC